MACLCGDSGNPLRRGMILRGALMKSRLSVPCMEGRLVLLAAAASALDPSLVGFGLSLHNFPHLLCVSDQPGQRHSYCTRQVMLGRCVSAVVHVAEQLTANSACTCGAFTIILHACSSLSQNHRYLCLLAGYYSSKNKLLSCLFCILSFLVLVFRQ